MTHSIVCHDVCYYVSLRFMRRARAFSAFRCAREPVAMSRGSAVVASLLLFCPFFSSLRSVGMSIVRVLRHPRICSYIGFMQ